MSERILVAEDEATLRHNIERFLDAIRSRESFYTTTAGFFLETGFGYDSNVSGGALASAELYDPGSGT